jgi:hypothetical protein
MISLSSVKDSTYKPLYWKYFSDLHVHSECRKQKLTVMYYKMSVRNSNTVYTDHLSDLPAL